VSEVAVKVEDLSQVKKKISFEIPWTDVKEEMDSVYREIGKKARIKGFRPGKVPRKVLENYFKADAENETVTNLINKHYWQALEDRKMVSLSRPDIEQDGLKPEAAYSFSATFETEPDFAPQGYEGIEIEKTKTVVTEENLETRLKEIRKMFSTMVDVTDGRPSIMGDFVTIDFDGTLDGEALPELKAEGYLLELGSGRFVPGFEQQVVGMTVGTTKDINVTFPEDYHEKKMAGKEVIFSVALKELKEQKLPEIDDNFIKNFDKYETLDDLKNDVRKSLEEQCTRADDAKFHETLIEELLKINSFEAPPSLVERQVFYMMSDTQRRMTAAGMDQKNAMELSFRMHDQLKPEAEKSVRSFLLIKKIAEKENISVSDADIEQHLRELAEMHGRDYEAIKAAFDDEERRNGLQTDLLQKKIFDFIESKANIKVVEKIGMETEAAK